MPHFSSTFARLQGPTCKSICVECSNTFSDRIHLHSLYRVVILWPGMPSNVLSDTTMTVDGLGSHVAGTSFEKERLINQTQ